MLSPINPIFSQMHQKVGFKGPTLTMLVRMLTRLSESNIITSLHC